MRKLAFSFAAALLAAAPAVADQVTYTKTPCALIVVDGIARQDEVVFRGLPSPDDFKQAWDDPSNCSVTIDLGETRLGPNDPLLFLYDGIVSPAEKKDSGGCGSSGRDACAKSCDDTANEKGVKVIDSDCIGWMVVYGQKTWICKCTLTLPPKPGV